MSSFRCALLTVGLAWALPAAAQQIAADPPLTWQADARANRQAQKAAEKAAEKAMPRAPAGADAASGEPGGAAGRGPRGEGGPGGPDGEGGPGGRGGPGGGPGGASREGGAGARVSAASMLRPEMEFAAPLKDTLILYRSRDAVVFGRARSEDVVILPLSGDTVTIAPGVTAILRDEPAALRLEIATSRGVRVDYRYSTPRAGVLAVEVRAEGPVPRPGSRFDVQRVYRLDASAK